MQIHLSAFNFNFEGSALMKLNLLRVSLIALTLVCWPLMAMAADPVPIDCDPSTTCKPIDPCAINPDRCKEPSIPTTPPPKLPDQSKDTDKKSENTGDFTEAYLPAANDHVAQGTSNVKGNSCIDQGLQCTLNGTPCCAPYTCEGKFPNTYCK